MTAGHERIARMLVIFTMVAGAVLAVMSELYPDEDEVCCQGLVSGLGW